MTFIPPTVASIVLAINDLGEGFKNFHYQRVRVTGRTMRFG